MIFCTCLNRSFNETFILTRNIFDDYIACYFKETQLTSHASLYCTSQVFVLFDLPIYLSILQIEGNTLLQQLALLWHYLLWWSGTKSSMSPTYAYILTVWRQFRNLHEYNVEGKTFCPPLQRLKHAWICLTEWKDTDTAMSHQRPHP